MFRIGYTPRKPLTALLLVLLIILAPVLAGCDRDRGWAALTGRGEHWEAMVTVHLQENRVAYQTIVRYLCPDEFSGPVEVITKQRDGEYRVRGPHDGNRIGISGRSTSYGSWSYVKNGFQSIKVQVIWETPEGKRTETISVSE